MTMINIDPITMPTMRSDHLIQALQGVDQTPTETELIARLNAALNEIDELREMLKQKTQDQESDD